MQRLDIAGLPEGASAAAAAFHATWLDRVRAVLASVQSLTLVFPPAGHDHTAWRLAAVQTLAREAAPLRINAVAGDDPAGLAATLAYLAAAEGLTGQYLPLAGPAEREGA